MLRTEKARQCHSEFEKGPDQNLRMALIQPRLARGELESNLARLLELNRRAAAQGCKLILNTEMALSGYAFQGREEIAGRALAESDPRLERFAELAQEWGVWICLGFAELEPETGMLYNSACVFDPQGGWPAKRRKVTAEPRWSCPGPPEQLDVCDTPWGRLGLLLCSETYYGLLPRVQALKGVDLLLTPANWPQGGLDPKDLWLARAWENGFYLAACNRSGREDGMDFSGAPSCVLDPDGRDLPLFRLEEEILLAEIPLEDGRLQTRRAQRLAGRRPEDYHPVYAYLRQAQADLGTYYDLPEPGELHIHCLALEGCRSLDQLAGGMAEAQRPGPNLFALPALDPKTVSLQGLAALAKERQSAIFASQAIPGQGLRPLYYGPDGERFEPRESLSRAFHLKDLGPARLGLALLDDLHHPELAASLAKLGCDVAVASGSEPWAGPRQALAVKTAEKLALACAAPGLGLICRPPAGHGPWQEVASSGQGTCSLPLDTRPLRTKFFMDRVDYQWLFGPEATRRNES